MKNYLFSKFYEIETCIEKEKSINPQKMENIRKEIFMKLFIYRKVINRKIRNYSSFSGHPLIKIQRRRQGCENAAKDYLFSYD